MRVYGWPAGGGATAAVMAACLMLPACLPDTGRTEQAGAGQQEDAQMTPGGTKDVPEPAPAGRSPDIPPPVLDDAESARRIYAQALAQDSNAALIMYLARNPDTPQAADARLRLAIRRNPDAHGAAQAVAGMDAGLVSEFDAARLAYDAGAGDAGPLHAFMAQYHSHPLAAEAGRVLAAR